MKQVLASTSSPKQSPLIQNHAFDKLRAPFASIMASQHEESAPVVIIDHAFGGGANMYRQNLISESLINGNHALLLTYLYHHQMFQLTYYVHHNPVDCVFYTYEELFDLLNRIKIQKLFVNNLVGYPEPFEMLTILQHIQAASHPEITIAIHDYNVICPSFHLLNVQGDYCGIPDIETCKRCLPNNHLFYMRMNTYHDIETWRMRWKEFLEQCHSILCFSLSSKTLIRMAYPDLPDEKFRIEPHRVENIVPVKIPPKTDDRFHIGILGNINFQKGSQILKTMVRLLEQRQMQNIRMILIGQLYDDEIQSPYFTITGNYQREELCKIVMQYQIDLFFLPSICPETFSYTTEEVINMNLPIAVFDLGAPAERVKNYRNGIIIEKIDPEAALKKILNWFQMIHRGNSHEM